MSGGSIFFFIQDGNSVLLTATVRELQEDGDDEGVSRSASLGWEGSLQAGSLYRQGLISPLAVVHIFKRTPLWVRSTNVGGHSRPGSWNELLPCLKSKIKSHCRSILDHFSATLRGDPYPGHLM